MNLEENKQVYFYLLGAKFTGIIIKIFANHVIVRAKIGNSNRTVKLYKHSIHEC